MRAEAAARRSGRVTARLRALFPLLLLCVCAAAVSLQILRVRESKQPPPPAGQRYAALPFLSLQPEPTGGGGNDDARPRDESVEPRGSVLAPRGAPSSALAAAPQAMVMPRPLPFPPPPPEPGAPLPAAGAHVLAPSGAPAAALPSVAPEASKVLPRSARPALLPPAGAPAAAAAGAETDYDDVEERDTEEWRALFTEAPAADASGDAPQAAPAAARAQRSPPLSPGSATAAAAADAAEGPVRVQRVRLAMREPEEPPSDTLYEAARGVFDATGALLAEDLRGRPLSPAMRCWIAEQPPEVAQGKANCALAARGDKCLSCWPGFYIAGAPKAGTTVLWRTLRRHPQVAPRDVKEAHFWDWLWPSNAAESLGRSERYADAAGADYAAHAADAAAGNGALLSAAFPALSAKERAALPFLVGDGDPNYMYSHMRFPWVTQDDGVDNSTDAGVTPRSLTFSTAEVMRATVPDARLIFVLREPGARALSHMRMVCEAACRREAARPAGEAPTRAHKADMDRCGGGGPACPASAATWAAVVARELEDLRLLCTGTRARNGSALPVAPDCSAVHALHAPGGHRGALRALSTGTWAGRSVYWPWLAEWLRMWPRKQLLFVRYEDWVSDPDATAARLFDFLGLQPLAPAALAQLPRPREDTAGDDAAFAAPETRHALRAFYEPHNEALADLLDEDARWTWRDVYAKAERTTDKNA
jgi:hypothetical protein